VPEAMEITMLEVSVVTMLLYWSSTLTTMLEMVLTGDGVGGLGSDHEFAGGGGRDGKARGSGGGQGTIGDAQGEGACLIDWIRC